ncbi:nucleotidyltransferase family protein [Subtercola frigoramans]|uniref:CTP:molybdopterin cytidylyltransferase MocA n=1 Tax=Subtercola frigoramans TaxID=120298 RepID=A0ABS2L780_9MICO|nr:nucleotidyltransferase family protein [Subtercola frigoramans]MBM7472934.1 CTP:molybdopterin cytidylyltransferase MocA [Subtercola frigoramans]
MSSAAAESAPAQVAGLVLAAGAGRRFGGPKALARTAAGEAWVVRSTRTLQAAGCSPVVIAVGADADNAVAVIGEEFGADTDVLIVVVDDWVSGMAASLRAGIAELATHAPVAAGLIVTLVDLPDLPLSAVERVIARAFDTRGAQHALVQAAYSGAPGHPVFIGRAHWGALAAGLSGDAGAKNYLAEHNAVSAECGELWDGTDVDYSGTPDDVAPGTGG